MGKKTGEIQENKSHEGIFLVNLRLMRNQDQEEALMTISTLLKKLLGVNGVVVEEVAFKTVEAGEQMVVQGHVTRHERQRCPICGRKCPLYDRGAGNGGDGGWMSETA